MVENLTTYVLAAVTLAIFGAMIYMLFICLIAVFGVASFVVDRSRTMWRELLMLIVVVGYVAWRWA